MGSIGRPYSAGYAMRSMFIDAQFHSLLAESSIPQSSVSSTEKQSTMNTNESSSLNMTIRQPPDGLPPIITPTATSTHLALRARATRTRYRKLRATPLPIETLPPLPDWHGSIMQEVGPDDRHLRMRAIRGSIVWFLFSDNHITGAWITDFRQDHVRAAMCDSIQDHLDAFTGSTGGIANATIMVPGGTWEGVSPAIELMIQTILRVMEGTTKVRMRVYGPAVKALGGDGFWLFKATQGNFIVEDIYIPQEQADLAMEEAQLQIEEGLEAPDIAAARARLRTWTPRFEGSSTGYSTKTATAGFPAGTKGTRRPVRGPPLGTTVGRPFLRRPLSGPVGIGSPRSTRFTRSCVAPIV